MAIDKLCNMWTKQWPTEPGFYFFYGWAFLLKRKRDGQPRLMFVKVRGTAQPGVMVYIGDGNFIYESETDGVWVRAITPTLPVDIDAIV